MSDMTEYHIGDCVRYIGTQGDVWGEVVGVHGTSVEVRWMSYFPVQRGAWNKGETNEVLDEALDIEPGDMVQLAVEMITPTLLVKLDNRPRLDESVAAGRERYIDWAVDRMVACWEKAEPTRAIVNTLSFGDRALMAEIKKQFYARTEGCE